MRKLFTSTFSAALVLLFGGIKEVNGHGHGGPLGYRVMGGASSLTRCDKDCFVSKTAKIFIQPDASGLGQDWAGLPVVLLPKESETSTFSNDTTWLMRLEGLPEDKWKPEIEPSRQPYRLLAEKDLREGVGAGFKMHQEDLESAIRLERMDLGELQGLPQPSQ
ncbi:MAG: hypothetical protein P8L18_03340 [Verrucomicrobiota bacterium]|nr:hypothetical protein [Verrucomicrobiota bacterium]